ncbi:molecular chaperone GrpE [Verrucomicrobium sp. GAS474]|nr:molecular chaperone GrpE [Verrucomicrobium sp. GAS474]
MSEEVQKEEIPASPAAEASETPVDLAAELAKQTAKVAELQDKLVRTMAEWDNARKRIAKEKEEAIRFANEALLETLIPVVDNFELGMLAAANAADAKAISVGLQMVLGQMQNFLKESGLEAIDAEGKPFDPHRHEAIGHEHSETVAEGSVVTQRRKGYLLKGKLLRPSMVTVSEGKPEKSDKKEKAKSEAK